MSSDRSGGSGAEHRRRARDVVAGCAVVTVSDSRSAENDAGGDRIREALVQAGHQVVYSRWIPDEPEAVRGRMGEALARNDLQVLLFTGGTGIAARDGTPDAVRPFFTREITGFGELFRLLSYREIGAAAQLSRATAGTSGRLLVYCLPGSPHAVQLALQELILPELQHLVWELHK